MKFLCERRSWEEGFWAVVDEGVIPWQNLVQKLLWSSFLLAESLSFLTNKRLQIGGVLLHAPKQVVHKIFTEAPAQSAFCNKKPT